MCDVATSERELMVKRDRIDETALRQLFREGRTYRDWSPERVPEAALRELYELVALGPTSANCSPMRIAFVCSEEAKSRLLPLVDKGNRNATRDAPVTAIIAADLRFYDKLAHLYPHQPAAVSWFDHPATRTARAALQNSSLQGGYFILAARALGLDCGPMGGFNANAIAEEFFPDRQYEVNFLCNVGYGRESPDYVRLPRLSFDDACQVV